MSQAGCDELAGAAGPKATAETSKRDRDMPGKEKSWCISIQREYKLYTNLSFHIANESFVLRFPYESLYINFCVCMKESKDTFRYPKAFHKLYFDHTSFN
jgi:hypothetical protein